MNDSTIPPFRTPYGTMSNAIRSLRIERGLTQCQLAKRINRTQGAVASYESGRICPSIKTAALLAREFNVPYEFLVQHRRSVFSPNVGHSPVDPNPAWPRSV